MWLSDPLKSFGEGVRFPVLRVCKVNLLLLPDSPFLIIETAQSQFLTEYDTLISKVKIDSPVQSLDAILYKQRHLDVFVLEKSH